MQGLNTRVKRVDGGGAVNRMNMNRYSADPDHMSSGWMLQPFTLYYSTAVLLYYLYYVRIIFDNNYYYYYYYSTTTATTSTSTTVVLVLVLHVSRCLSKNTANRI